MNWKAAAFVFIGLAGLLLFLYCGLNTAERGITELLALEETPLRVLSLALEENGILITFAGRCYFFDCRRYMDIYTNLFSELCKICNNSYFSR